MISHQHRAIFVHIQKTGGTSVSVAMGGQQFEPFKHATAQQAREHYGDAWSDYFRFSIVRNPWARLLSWWTAIQRTPESTSPFRVAVRERCRTFDDFVRFADDITQDGYPVSVHRTQSAYLTDASGNLMVEFVGRYERLADDVEAISRRLAAPLGPLLHMNKTTHGRYVDAYTPTLARYVGEIYAADVDRFGYHFGDERHESGTPRI